MKYFIASLAVCLCLKVYTQEIIAHAHNDYLHDRPLLDALEKGFQSIEVDIYEYKGALKVSHFAIGLGGKPTLQELYLDPLEQYLANHPEARLWLLIDLKQGRQKLLDLLHSQIAEKGHLFQSRKQMEVRPVQVILSGSVDRQLVADNSAYEYFYLDGRIEHLKEGQWDTSLMPLISANFSKVVSWNGEGEMSVADKKAIKQVVELSRAQEKKLRFWKTLDSENVWTALEDLGVAVIGTDDLARLATFVSRDR